MLKNTVTVIDGVETVVTVLHDGNLYTAIRDHHPNFQAIVSGLSGTLDPERILDLFDVERAVNARFQRLSDRVTTRDGNVLFDGDVVHNSLTEQVLRFLNEGVDDWKPLVKFFENVQQNPSENSREQLFEWLANDESLTITDQGLIVGYKGVHNGPDGIPTSTRPAPASEQVTVNDEPVEGYVPNPDGAVVAMPRSFVDPAEANYCSVGLHVGTFRYARDFGGGNVLQVHVNPRDVVSVTSDSNREKIRTCRYEVVGKVESKVESPLYTSVGYDYDEDEAEGYDDSPETIECGGCFDDFEESDLNDEGYCIECAVELAQEEAADEVRDSWDTRLNHTRQQRGPGGRFLPSV